MMINFYNQKHCNWNRPGTDTQNDECYKSCDLIFYDIPARYNYDEVVSALKQLGDIEKLKLRNNKNNNQYMQK